MVATDTVVGIVGAVVLLAVMAGVFVYEYNNAPEADSAAAAQEHFEEDYAGLAATQDMDGDRIPNFEDDDIDGDGTPNAEDDMLATSIPVNANVAAPGPTGGAVTSQTFRVDNGSVHLEGTLTYARQNCNVAAPNVQATLRGPAGFDAVTAQSTCTGTTVSLAFDIQEELPAGNYTLELTQLPAGGVLPIGQAATVQGTLEVHYATPEGGGHSHD